MSNELSAAMSFSGWSGWGHYTWGLLLLPLDPCRGREAALAGEVLVVGDVEAGQVPLAVVVGDAGHPLGGGVDGQRGIRQLRRFRLIPLGLLGEEGDLDSPAGHRLPIGPVALLEL